MGFRVVGSDRLERLDITLLGFTDRADRTAYCDQVYAKYAAIFTCLPRNIFQGLSLHHPETHREPFDLGIML